MSEIDIGKFLKSNIDQEELDKFDSEAGFWFLVYETGALILALLQFESVALQVNIGLLNFVVSGILYLLFEWTKLTSRIDYRIAVFRFLRWYIVMLVSALISVSIWFVYYSANYASLVSIGLVGQAATLSSVTIPCFAVFFLIVKAWDTRYRNKIANMIKHDKDQIAFDVATKFLPTGVTSLALVNYFSISVFLGTLISEPFNITLLESIINTPLSWGLSLLLLPIALILTIRFTTAEQRNLILRFDSVNV